MENMQGVRHLINRQPLGTGLGLIVAAMQQGAKLPLHEPGPTGSAEVKEVLQLVDGQQLLAGIVANFIELLNDDEKMVRFLAHLGSNFEAQGEPEPPGDTTDDVRTTLEREADEAADKEPPATT